MGSAARELHPGRRRVARDAWRHQPPDQEPGGLSGRRAVRAVHAAGGAHRAGPGVPDRGRRGACADRRRCAGAHGPRARARYAGTYRRAAIVRRALADPAPAGLRGAAPRHRAAGGHQYGAARRGLRHRHPPRDAGLARRASAAPLPGGRGAGGGRARAVRGAGPGRGLHAARAGGPRAAARVLAPARLGRLAAHRGRAALQACRAAGLRPPASRVAGGRRWPGRGDGPALAAGARPGAAAPRLAAAAGAAAVGAL